MWDLFPIQCKEDMPAQPLKTIHPKYKYNVFDEVNCKTWKDVPDQIKRWCMSIWKEEFGCMRCPLGNDDLLFWIEKQGMISAKKGIWVDNHKTKRIIQVSYNYVHPELRGKRIAERIIHTIGLKGSEIWNIDAFIFEVVKIPKSLKRRNAIPIAKFQYIWIPTMMIDNEWKPITNKEIKSYLFGKEGFHPDENVGYIGFQHSKSKNTIIVDSNDDIISYDSYLDLTTLRNRGNYCRVFSEIGTNYIFAENMYFEPTNTFKLI